MKKVLLICTIFLIFLAGCATELFKEKGGMVPSTEEVKDEYYKALEAFTWFESSSMPMDSSIKEMDGWIYNKVNHDTIKTFTDLEDYLYSLFADDIVEELLYQEYIRYRDIDGALYGIAADRGTHLYRGEETLEVLQESDVKFICEVEVEILGEDLKSVVGYETHQFLYEFINDQWVFTNFHLVR